MSNWSSDSYYFGRLHDFSTTQEHDRSDYQGKQNDIIASLAWAPHDGTGWSYRLRGISCFGPAVHVCGEGKWGAHIPLTAECWETLDSGIVVYEGYDGYSEVWEKRITINGEVVSKTEQSMFPERGEDGEPLPEEDDERKPWTFMGRTPEEQHFFKDFAEAVNQWNDENVIAHELMKMKLRKKRRLEGQPA